MSKDNTDNSTDPVPPTVHRDRRSSTFAANLLHAATGRRKTDDTGTTGHFDALYQEIETLDHVLPIQRLCDKLNTDVTRGMTREEAARVYQLNGPNALTPPKVTPEYIKFLSCMYGGFAAVLWLCALLSFIIYGVGLLSGHEEEGIEWFGVIVIVICFISGTFSYIQEAKNTKVMESFKRMVPVIATVVRDGVRLQLPAEEVVVGDVVEIRLGDKIPADIRIIEERGLRVENSSITGELNFEN